MAALCVSECDVVELDGGICFMDTAEVLSIY